MNKLIFGGVDDRGEESLSSVFLADVLTELLRLEHGHFVAADDQIAALSAGIGRPSRRTLFGDFVSIDLIDGLFADEVRLFIAGIVLPSTSQINYDAHTSGVHFERPVPKIPISVAHEVP